MLDSLASLFTGGLKAVLSFFPDSPFVVLDDLAASGEMAQWLRYLNWFVPVNSFVAIFEGWLLCVAMYYVWQVVLRWLKAIE